MTISWNYQKLKQNKQIFLHEESNHHYGGLEIYEKTYSTLSKMENASTDNVKFPRDGYLPKPENATSGGGSRSWCRMGPSQEGDYEKKWIDFFPPKRYAHLNSDTLYIN